MVVKGEVVGEGWIGSLGLVLYLEQINNKVLPYSTGNYIQDSVINHNRKEYNKEYALNTLQRHILEKNL